MRADELQRVEVEWIDAELDINASAELTDLSPFLEELPLVEDLGYLVSIDKDRLILAVSRSILANDVRHRNAIPTALVKSIRYLETGQCLTSAQILRTHRKANSSTATKNTTSPPGSVNGSVLSSPSTTPRSTTRSPKEPSP